MYNIQCILFDHISHTFMTLFSSIVILYKQKIIGTCVRLCVCGYEHRKQIKIRVKQTKEFKKQIYTQEEKIANPYKIFKCNISYSKPRMTHLY